MFTDVASRHRRTGISPCAGACPPPRRAPGPPTREGNGDMRRRNLLAATPLVAAGLAGIGGTGGGSATAPDTHWSTAVVDSTIKRHSATSIGGWGYTVGLYLYGQYLVYKRTGTASYLSYIRTWADR